MSIVLEGFTVKVAELQLGKPFFQAPFFYFTFSPKKLRLKKFLVYILFNISKNNVMSNNGLSFAIIDWSHGD